MKTNQLKVGAILSYIQMGVSLLIGIIYTPIMIRLLGQSEYGVYNATLSTVGFLSVLSLGIGTGYIKYYAKYKKENDQESIYKLNGLFLIIFLIIGLVALICGTVMTLNIRLIFSDGLTDAEYNVAKVLMFVMTVNTAMNFSFGIFATIISAHERFIFLKSAGIIKTVIGPLFNIVILYLGYRSVGMAVFSLIITVVTEAIYFAYLIFKLKNKFIFRGFEKGIFKSLFVYTGFIALNMIVDQINWNVDKVLLGRFVGSAAVAVYAVGASLQMHYISFSTAISGVFTPKIHRIINETADNDTKQRVALTDLFIRVGRIQFLILGLILTGVIFFGKPFIVNYWAGEGYDEAYIIAVALMASGTISLIQNVGIEIQRALNRHKFRAIAYFCMAVLNVVISIFLCQKYGAVGCVIGTVVAVILANGVMLNIYMHKRCNVDIIAFWKNILRMMLGWIPVAVVGIVINIFFDLTNIWMFIIGVGAYSCVYCASMWLLSMNKYEKQLIISPIKKVLEKLR
ncbi:MAG: polysaccharide biosynthesis protein [Ruminococcaceae bacterium]|nr:polysaccharide biosynthesis protein [Oscillospiraceae bacterium]